MSRQQIDAALRALRNAYSRRNGSIQVLRRALDAAAGITPLPPGVARTRFDIEGLPVAWIDAPGSSTRHVTLFLHGGGFLLGSIKSHSNIAARLAQATGTRALLVDYRLAPEHPFPAALEDTTVAWRWLLNSGQRPDQVIVAGDSAGGGLALSALVSWRDAGLPLPACAVLFSPWVDLSCSAPSLQRYGPEEPLITEKWCRLAAEHYAKAMDKTSSAISPLRAALEGLPPLLIQAGGRDALLDDARRLAEKAANDGVSAKLEVWDDMPHAFQLFGSVLDEAEEALTRAGEFVRRRVAGKSVETRGNPT